MKPKNREIIRAMQKANGHLGIAAATLGVSYVTLYRWMVDDPELQAAKKEVKALRVAVGVDALMDRIKKGDTAAIIFFLKTQCKDDADENFSERLLQPSEKQGNTINVIAQNANFGLTNKELENLSVEELRTLTKLLEKAKPEAKDEVIDAEYTSD